jgi:hypothetical protein
MRLRDVLAEGPSDRKPIDDKLIRLGWLEPYGEEYDSDYGPAVDATDGAEARLYGPDGCVRPELIAPELETTR